MKRKYVFYSWMRYNFMKFSIITTSGLFLLLLSCKKEKEAIPIIQLSYIDMMQDDEIIGKPGDLAVYDSLLIVLDKMGDFPFHMYDRVNKKYISSVGTYGNGPLEFNNVHNIYNVKDQLFTYDINMKRYYKISFNNLHLGDFKAEELWRGDTLIHFYPLPMNDGNFLCLGSYKDYRVKIVDAQGKLQKSQYEYPYRDNTEKLTEPKFRSLAYRGPVTGNPDGDKFVQAMSSCDMIAIYKIKEGHLDMKEIINSYPTYKVEADEKGYSVPTSAYTPKCYLDVAATNKYIYLLYSGSTYAEKRMDAFSAKQVFVYDWDGILKDKLLLDLPTKLICPTADDKTLYTISLNPDCRIMEYELALF